MPDITMCPDDACPRKRTCYRHPASWTKPLVVEGIDRQCWFVNSPRWFEGCAYYWAVELVEEQKGDAQ